MELVQNNLATYSSNHKRSSNSLLIGLRISYGTAGFRANASLLDSVIFRVGIAASLRSKFMKGKAIGLMVTASHNPEEDNGIKIIDPMGEMMDSSWESWITDFVNEKDDETTLVSVLKQFIKTNSIDLTIKAVVLIGRDTRESSLSLSEAAMDGVKVMDGKITDFGLLTTPQLHFLVRCSNDPSYGVATEFSYYYKLSQAFLSLNTESSSRKSSNYEPDVVVDCANGVGSVKLTQMIDFINTRINVTLVNAGEGILNSNCGADYVKLYQESPKGLTLKPNQRTASFDGDADRIVYYFVDDFNTFQLLDGDKIALLYIHYLKQLLELSGLEEKLSLRMIQTAYANGSSTLYCENVLRVKTDCVPTGVKHLHSRAKDYDISVYFEANGHGTILFSEKSTELINFLANDDVDGDDVKTEAGKKLSFIINLVNQTTGDAIADLLLVESILRNVGWSVKDWNDLYQDLPSRQIKVKVVDRNLVTTCNAERTCATPTGLQDAIDAHVRKAGENSRCFVRPSGTEDIVRVYAEAMTQEKADQLADAVADAVREMVDMDYDDK